MTKRDLKMELMAIASRLMTIADRDEYMDMVDDLLTARHDIEDVSDKLFALNWDQPMAQD
jgi:hypothetical protein